MAILIISTLVLSAVLLAIPAWLTNRWDLRLFRSGSRTLVRHFSGIVAVGGCLWLLQLAQSWLLSGLWLVLTVAVLAVLVLFKARLDRRRLWLSLAASMLLVVTLVGVAVLYVVGLLESPMAFVGTMAVLLAHVYSASASGLHAYFASKRATTAHQEYLLGNGATVAESLRPSVVRGLRAALVPGLKSMSVVSLLTLPLVLSGQLLGGVEPVLAVCTTWLLLVGGLSGGVFTLLLTLWLGERKGKL